MKYVSIDLETTGLDLEHDSFLEIAAVVGDTMKPNQPIIECPSFTCTVKTDHIAGNPKALAMNARIIRMISEGKGMTLKDIYDRLDTFMAQHAQLTERKQFWAAGKNFATFDMHFIDWKKMSSRPHFRVLEPAMLFWNPLQDMSIPSLSECCARANVSVDTGELHSALYDARLVVSLINQYTLMCQRDIPHPFL